jgi:hypothetical protein
VNRRDEATAVYETGTDRVADQMLELGWELIEVLSAPPSAGSPIRVLGWFRSDEPRYPDA